MNSAQPGGDQRPERSDCRLKRRSLIEHLFAREASTVTSIANGPVVILFDIVDTALLGSTTPYQAGVTANRRIRRAVDRNSIKRHLREAVQSVHEQLLHVRAGAGKSVICMLIYRDRSVRADIQRHAEEALRSMMEKIRSTVQQTELPE